MSDTTIIILITVGVLVVFGAIAYRTTKGIIGGHVQAEATKQQVIDNGIVAEATVIDVWETGYFVTQDRELGLRLNITPPHQPPYEAEAKFLASPLEIVKLQPGQVTAVYIDLNDPQNIVIKRRLNDYEAAMAEKLGLGDDSF